MVRSSELGMDNGLGLGLGLGPIGAVRSAERCHGSRHTAGFRVYVHIRGESQLNRCSEFGQFRKWESLSRFRT